MDRYKGLHQAYADREEQHSMAVAAGHRFLIDQYFRQVAAATLIQRAFRAWKTRHYQGGGGGRRLRPSDSFKRFARARYLQGPSSRRERQRSRVEAGGPETIEVMAARFNAMMEAQAALGDFQADAEERVSR